MTGLYQTTPEQLLRVYAIAFEMKGEGLPMPFITAAVKLASDSEGVYDLMELWAEEDDDQEKEETIKAIQELISGDK